MKIHVVTRFEAVPVSKVPLGSEQFRKNSKRNGFVSSLSPREKFVSRRPIYTELSVSQIESLANCSPTAEQAIDSTSRSLPRTNRYFRIFVRVAEKFDFDDLK